MKIREGNRGDTPIVLALFDEAVAWLVTHGNAGQWGTEPWSSQPDKIARVGEMMDGGQLWIVEIDGAPAGALITGDRPPAYASPAGEPELYVLLLLVSRRHAGEKIGLRLLDFAKQQARSHKAELMRVDCYAGGTGDLVRYYTRAGFTPTETFHKNDRPMQLFEQRV